MWQSPGGELPKHPWKKVTCWLVVEPTPLKNDGVSWDGYSMLFHSQYDGKVTRKIPWFQSPPTSKWSLIIPFSMVKKKTCIPMYYPIIYHPKKAQKPEKTHQQWQLQLMSLRLRGNCGNTKRIHGLDLMGSWTLEPPGHGDGHGWPWMAMDGHGWPQLLYHQWG